MCLGHLVTWFCESIVTIGSHMTIKHLYARDTFMMSHLPLFRLLGAVAKTASYHMTSLI